MVYKLNDIVTIKYGKNQKNVIDDNGEYPILGTGGIMGFANKYLYDKSSVLIGRKGTIDKVQYIDKPFWTIDTLFYTEINEDITIPKYLYYKLKEIDFKNMNEGTTIPSLRTQTLYEIELDIDELEVQKKIVKILDDIDRKLELNNQINDNLFEIALSIFNKFLEDNVEIGNIKLEECVEKINTGADAIQRAPIVDYDTGIRCIRIGDMTNNRPYYSWGFTNMTEKDFDNYKLLRNDIVITRTAVNGLTYMITTEENVVCNNGNIRLRVNSKFNPLYIYLYTKTKEFKDYIDRINGETSVRPNMKVEYLTSFLIKNIDIDKQNDICQTIQPIMDKIQNNKIENHSLEKLRDILLPKLMNAEIDLNKIEI